MLKKIISQVVRAFHRVIFQNCRNYHATLRGSLLILQYFDIIATRWDNFQIPLQLARLPSLISSAYNPSQTLGILHTSWDTKTNYNNHKKRDKTHESLDLINYKILVNYAYNPQLFPPPPAPGWSLYVTSSVDVLSGVYDKKNIFAKHLILSFKTRASLELHSDHQKQKNRDKAEGNNCCKKHFSHFFPLLQPLRKAKLSSRTLQRFAQGNSSHNDSCNLSHNNLCLSAN